MILLKFSLNDFIYNKSLTRLTSRYLFWLSSLSNANINLPTYHIYSITLVLPFCVNYFVMSIISKITSWLFSTNKSNILEKFYVLIQVVNCLHYKKRKWIDNTSSKSCWFWIDFYIVSLSNIRSYLLKCWRLSIGLVRNLNNCNTLYGNWRKLSLSTFCMISLLLLLLLALFSVYFYF